MIHMQIPALYNFWHNHTEGVRCCVWLMFPESMMVMMYINLFECWHIRFSHFVAMLRLLSTHRNTPRWEINKGVIYTAQNSKNAQDQDV